MFYQIVLEETDSASDEQSNESICSMQAELTASAKDSSDITTEFSSEFELASSPEIRPHPWSYGSYCSSSGNSSHLANENRIFIERLIEESDPDVCEVSTGGSDSDTDDDIQILKFPRCIMCSAPNENHFFQFCHSCYQIKKSFFPQKPKPKFGKSKHMRTLALSNKDYAPVFSRSESKGKTASCELEEYFENEMNANSLETTGCTSNGQMLNKWHKSIGAASPNCTQDSGIGSNSTPNGPLTDAQMDDKCLACFVNEANALFLHGKTGHRCCCYNCAKRIWLETRRCPICRSKVNNIIKILNS